MGFLRERIHACWDSWTCTWLWSFPQEHKWKKAFGIETLSPPLSLSTVLKNVQPGQTQSGRELRHREGKLSGRRDTTAHQQRLTPVPFPLDHVASHVSSVARSQEIETERGLVRRLAPKQLLLLASNLPGNVSAVTLQISAVSYLHNNLEALSCITYSCFKQAKLLLALTGEECKISS